jgi:hypothetical protein
MACNLLVIEIGQEYLDWANKLRQDRRPVTHDDVGHYAVQSSGGEIVADGFPDRGAAEECVDHFYVQTVSLALTGEAGESNRWLQCLDGGGTKGVKNPGDRFTELKAVTIVFDYPHTPEARFEFTAETGFARAEIIEYICTAFRKIYAEVGTRAPHPICCLVRSSNKGRSGAPVYLMAARIDVEAAGTVTLRIGE